MYALICNDQGKVSCYNCDNEVFIVYPKAFDRAEGKSPFNCSNCGVSGSYSMNHKLIMLNKKIAKVLYEITDK
jgi:hypothetical protein